MVLCWRGRGGGRAIHIPGEFVPGDAQPFLTYFVHTVQYCTTVLLTPPLPLVPRDGNGNGFAVPESGAREGLESTVP